jgi:hypothetical protein
MLQAAKSPPERVDAAAAAALRTTVAPVIRYFVKPLDTAGIRIALQAADAFGRAA